MSMRSMRRTALAALLAFSWPAPLLAQDSWLSLSLGRFAVRDVGARIPDDVVTENLSTFYFFPEDFNGTNVGAEWLVGVGNYVEVGAGVGWYKRTAFSVYDQHVRPGGSAIEQDFSLQVAPLTGTARFFPFGRRSVLQPYAGAGIGLFNWRYTEVGDFIDFGDPDWPVFFGEYTAAGRDAGRIYLAGGRVAGGRYAAGIEFRYQDAQGVVGIDQGFLDERIDLGGMTTAFTLNVGF